MTALAIHASMASCQRELREIVIEVDMIPAGWVMTRRAIASILAAVRIILIVTGVAVSWRALIYVVDMTGCTGNFLVLSFELEGCQVVIELRRCPAVLIMAVRAFGA